MKIFHSNKLTPGTLPKDSRKLLCTPRTVNIEKMGSGEFWFNGLEASLKKWYKNLDKPTEIELIFNIDGLPIFRGSPIEFWPILCGIHGKQTFNPITIAIYCGQGKPPLEPFLKDFVAELNKIVLNGLNINGNLLLTVRIKCFICDTPARNYILGSYSVYSRYM